MCADQARPSVIRPDEDGYFSLSACDPDKWTRFMERTASQKVVVVGIFGKTLSRDAYRQKAFLFDEFLQRDVFRSLVDCDVFRSDQPVIEGFHDEKTNRIFLHFSATSLDCVRMLGQQRLPSSPEYLTDMKWLLLLMQICHVLICYHPSSVIDLSYISLFQALDASRSKLSESTAGCESEWASRGRLCLPRMLFYFASPPLALRGSKGVAELIKRDGSVSKHPPIRKLEFCLEDQLYRILRRAKIVSNSSHNCLFSLSSRDGCVYVSNGPDDNFGDATLAQMSDLLRTLGDCPDDDVDNSNSFVPYFYQQSLSEFRSKNPRSFSNFVLTHLESISAKAAEQATNDTLKYNFELPTASQWYDGVSDLIQASTHQATSGLPIASLTDIEAKFSEARCAKALPLAIAAYKEGLPAHYSKEHHVSKRLQAMALFSVQARGPAVRKYAELLAEECTLHWKSGRQMCEELSLTGQKCTNRKHQTAAAAAAAGLVSGNAMDSAIEEDSRRLTKKVLPTMPHNSGAVYTSACNCGRRQAERHDPFVLIDANYIFYADLEEDCCHDLENIDVPVFQRVASSGQRANEFLSSDLQDNDDPDELTEVERDGNMNLFRQSSAFECIQTMLTKSCGAQLLPAFPSWALTQLGSSHLYSHSSGVNQPGFLAGTKNLHPWDVPLKKCEWKTLQEKWPNIAEYAVKKPNFNIHGKGIEMGLTVKIFFGLEYECPRGHRFIAALPDRGVRPKNSSGVASTSAAAKFLASDISLYMTCNCRNSPSRPLVAQLMRLHVVTPKAPLHVALLPNVMPCPDGPVFHPGWSQPVKLPINSYWVLRFPYIYCSESGCHLPPKEMPSLTYGRLLKGFISITEEYEYK